jgi:methyltransferase
LIGAVSLLEFVAAERLTELILARRNTTSLLKRGTREVALSHYPLIVAFTLHGLADCGFSHGSARSKWWLLPFVAVQILRFWVLVTLGERWTTRIVILPGAPLVKAGPYRFLDHPTMRWSLQKSGSFPSFSVCPDAS